jgi:2-polyprenyl-3-methyl-5-hydroxy-6-metoxy-1,4-benzoquinol methylase
MISFASRSKQKELLDEENIPFHHIKKNMEELEFINRTLGGHKITISGIKKLLNNNLHSFEQVHVVEIGCGGGDNLFAIKEWARKSNTVIDLTGVDINPECINYAVQQERNKGIHFIISDYRDVAFDATPDIVFSSLFCHHFTDEQLTPMLKWMQNHSTIGFFINDLHRHPVAYYSIKFLTSLFSKSMLVKNDAPLSVLRSFKRADWLKLFDSAGIHNYNYKWKWAFRWLITCTANGND